MKKNIMTLLAIAVSLAGCGKKGPLVLEPEMLPPAVTELRLHQVGAQVELSWKFPTLLSDKKTPLQPAQIRGIAVYHLAKPFNPETFRKKSEILARPKAGELQRRADGTYAYGLPFKAKMLKDKEHAFALTYQYGRSHSDLSAIQKITTRTPPEPVRDLKASREGKVVILRWSRPQADSEGQPLPALAGYIVYRRILQGKNTGVFAAVSEKPVQGEYYEDRDTGTDGDYEYQVASLLDEASESAPSAAVRIKILDTFPPDIPANLVAFSAKDHVFLTWEAVRDRDLGHYNVYRKLSKEEDFKLLDAAVTDNFFRDRQVVKGQMYIYIVVAVDKKGNESEPSRAVRQLFE
jgi:predicted small lipoprotein YifL